MKTIIAVIIMLVLLAAFIITHTTKDSRGRRHLHLFNKVYRKPLVHFNLNDRPTLLYEPVEFRFKEEKWETVVFPNELEYTDWLQCQRPGIQQVHLAAKYKTGVVLVFAPFLPEDLNS